MLYSFQRSDRGWKLLLLLFSLDKPVDFSPKAFTSITLFVLTHIRKRVLQRLGKGFRNLTLNEKKLESTATQLRRARILISHLYYGNPQGSCWGSALCFLCPISQRSHCSIATKKTTFFIYEYLRNYQHHLLGKQRYWFLH